MNKEMFFIISYSAWCFSWIILAIKLDIITYIGFMLYGLGISGLSIHFALKFMALEQNKNRRKK